MNCFSSLSAQRMVRDSGQGVAQARSPRPTGGRQRGVRPTAIQVSANFPLLSFGLGSLLACIAVATTSAFAQPKPKPTDPSDAAWASISALSRTATAPAPSSVVVIPGASPIATNAQGPIPKTPVQIVTEKETRAMAFRQVSQAAKDFHTQYPTHANAAAARKLEATAGIEGITDTNKVHELAALKTADDYRKNKSYFAGDRFEVAHAVERLHLSRSNGGKPWHARPNESEDMTDRLRNEFGDMPHVHGSYLAIAEATDCENSGDIAAKVLQMRPAPEARYQAQRIFDRWKLIGQKLDFPLTTTDGRAFRLAQVVGPRTVVYVWEGTRDPKGPIGLKAPAKGAPSGTQWVYLSLGAFNPIPADAKARGTPTGTYCVEPLGMRSPVAEQLKISSLPWVCVLDATGTVVGFGRPSELPALLTRNKR